MFLTSTKWVLIAAVGLLTAAGVTGRPWEGDTDIRSGEGQFENLQKFGNYETCLETSCAGLIGESLLSCARNACRFASGAAGDAMDLLSCADAQCSGLQGWEYKTCISSRCLKVGLKVPGLSSLQPCVDQCRQLQTPKSVYECITSGCLSARASGSDVAYRLPSKRWVDRITCPTQCSSYSGSSLYRCCKGL